MPLRKQPTPSGQPPTTPMTVSTDRTYCAGGRDTGEHHAVGLLTRFGRLLRHPFSSGRSPSFACHECGAPGRQTRSLHEVTYDAEEHNPAAEPTGQQQQQQQQALGPMNEETVSGVVDDDAASDVLRLVRGPVVTASSRSASPDAVPDESWSAGQDSIAARRRHSAERWQHWSRERLTRAKSGRRRHMCRSVPHQLETIPEDEEAQFVPRQRLTIE